MNVLLVDDDRFVVAALERKIDWSSLSVSTVYTAHQIHQAKQILESNPVDICVCDIEMPCGSGLDLLSWYGSMIWMSSLFFLPVMRILTMHRKPFRWPHWIIS